MHKKHWYITNMKFNHLTSSVLLFLFALLLTLSVSAQEESKVTAEIDTTGIKIGEQIKYTITVETDSLNVVHFPEGQTFSPLETVEAIMQDTVKNNNKVVLQQVYALTQFDSGAYTIPPQRIAINEQPFFTDSFNIRVADVAVDTTKQKMYDIKPLIQVDKSYAKLWMTILWVVIALLLIAGLVYWFFLRKKPLTEEEKEALLPPYDRALLELKKLENSRYLIHDEYKKYYSELTDIVRSYLEEDVNVSALESTTGQLITKLELLKDAGELNLEHETIDQFQKILQTADLVKFAKSKPSTSVAEEDRKIVEQIVVKTHDALPEPTEEDLMLTAEYQLELAKKKQRKRIIWAAAIFVGLLIAGSAFSIAYYGYKEVKDTVLGHPTKDLLEGEWVASSYGYPPIEIETPQVLIRQEIELPEQAAEVVKSHQTFMNGKVDGLFSVSTNSTTYKEAVDPDFEALVEANLAQFEGMGVKNMLTKTDEFNTKSGVSGIKTYGSGSYENPSTRQSARIDYMILCFGGKGFVQQVVIYHEKGDAYAEQIVNRMLASLDVKTQV